MATSFSIRIMNRFSVTIAFTLTIVAIYQFIDLNFFTIDLPRRVSSELFKDLRIEPVSETEIVLFDTDNTGADSLRSLLGQLELFGPRVIGLNTCGFTTISKELDQYISQNENIIVCDCNPNSDAGTSAIINSDSVVTQFKTDKDTYFEIKLIDYSYRLSQRRNRRARINFRNLEHYYRVHSGEIGDLESEIVSGKIVLVGSFHPAFVTPVNEWYGYHGDKPDMSEIQISANILSTVTRNEYINEVPFILRILIVMSSALACAGLMRVVRTRHIIVNILTGLLILFVLETLNAFVIVFAFMHRYYLEMNEFSAVLIGAAIVSFYWNAKEMKMENHEQRQPEA